MVFSSTVFILIFLPLVVGIYYILPKALKNTFLLIASLGFYTWGEHLLVLLMITSITINYLTGRGIHYGQKKLTPKITTTILTVGVSLNLILLGYYKYASFLITNLEKLGLHISFDTSEIALPIGISFFTFQGISYLVDVYKQEIKCQKNYTDLGMYIALFPQLVAGPIVRYVDIEEQIKSRCFSKEEFSDGISRFIIGFAKKVLIANNMGLLADKVFAVEYSNLSTELSWLGIVCYSFQIFFDFSGYSDMAIGLGKMFGFTFRENFNYPYSAFSIKDFWRRWHISLSTWFRDYLYIPLGGNRRKPARTYVNLLTVFFLTGLWHGASWNFIVWGLFHGAFLILERNFTIKLPKWLSPLSWVYTMLVVLVGWVFFRADDLSSAMNYLTTMFVYHAGGDQYPYMFFDSFRILILILAIVFSFPVSNWVKRILARWTSLESLTMFKYVGLLLLFLISIMEMAQTTYNPFIYYRF